MWTSQPKPGAKTIKKNTNSTRNKRQTYRAKQYKVTSFLSTDCELSTNPCSKNVYSLGPRPLTKPMLITCTSEFLSQHFGTKAAAHP